MCKLLAARISHQAFGEWVDHELNGYPNVSGLPDYRIIRVDSYGLRIPRHLDTQPTIIWTLVPRALGHLIHVHLDRQSERSDAGLHC